MLSATDAFPDRTPADQRHTQVVIRDHFSDIDDDDPKSEAASQSSDIGLDDEAHPRAGDVSVARDMCDGVAVDMTVDVTAPLVVDTGDTFGAADPHRGTRAGSCPASHLSMATPPTAGESTEVVTPAATNLTAPFPPDMTGCTADGATATAASATDTGVDVDTDPNPAKDRPSRCRTHLFLPSAHTAVCG